MQTHTLFAAMNDETSSSQRSDFQDEDAKCKIFTCCGEVNKLPSLACWDQSKVWAKDMKAETACGEGGLVGGTLVCVYLCMCAHACAPFSTCVNDCAESHRSLALRLRNEPAAKEAAAACGSRRNPRSRRTPASAEMKKTWPLQTE